MVSFEFCSMYFYFLNGDFAFFRSGGRALLQFWAGEGGWVARWNGSGRIPLYLRSYGY